MAGVTGDFAKLARIINRINMVATKDFHKKAVRQLATTAFREVHRNFELERDPYGRKWKRIKRAGRILQDKGLLKNSIHYSIDEGRSFTISTPVVYAAVHNFGHGSIERRQFIPAGDKLGPAMKGALENTLRSLMHREGLL